MAQNPRQRLLWMVRLDIFISPVIRLSQSNVLLLAQVCPYAFHQ